MCSGQAKGVKMHPVGKLTAKTLNYILKIVKGAGYLRVSAMVTFWVRGREHVDFCRCFFPTVRSLHWVVSSMLEVVHGSGASTLFF